MTASGSIAMMADAPDRFVSYSEGDERERIIVAAEQVVARDGICGLGVRAVCQRAGLSTHRFYDHFESKRDLLAAMLGIQLRTAAEVLSLAAHDRLPPIERIWRYLDCALDMAIDRLASAPTSIYARYWRVLMPYHRAMLEEGIFAVTRPLVAALADGHAHGVLCSPDPESDARVVYFLLTAMVYDRPCPAVINPREEFERCITPLVARSMGVPLPAGFSQIRT